MVSVISSAGTARRDGARMRTALAACLRHTAGVLLATLAVTSMSAVTSTSAMAQDANAPIAIGMVLSKQGVFSDIGRDGARGAMLAVDDVDAKVLGRPIKVIWYDDTDPQTAQQNMIKLIDHDKVVAVVGGVNSASSLAEGSVAKQNKIPLVVIVGSATEITGKSCNRYTFRTFYSAPVVTRALVPNLIEKGKRWYFLAPNYAAGNDAYKGMKKELLRLGGTEVGADVLPLGTTDFSAFILKIRQANPDVVAFSFAGQDLGNFLKQWSQFGMKDKIPVGGPFISESTLWSLDKNSQTGIYAKSWEYNDPALSPLERKFAAAYRAKYGEPASMVAWDGWMSMRAIIDGIKGAKSTDGPAIVQQLETIQWHDRELPSYYRSWDHQFIHSLLIVQARAPKADKWDIVDIRQTVPAKGEDIDKIFGDRAEVGCQMGEL